MTNHHKNTGAARWRGIALPAARFLLAAAFFAAGAAKLAGVEPIVELFDRVGWGQWFRYLTGLLEIGGAALLLVPSLAWLGAAGLSCIALGAGITNVLLGDNPAGAIVLFVLALVVLWTHRPASFSERMIE